MERNLLVVEDSEGIRNLIKTILGSKGFPYCIWEAEEGSSAFSVLKENRIDLILCDLLMPGMDGYQFLSILRSNPDYQDIPLIILSVKGEVEERIRGLDNGAWDYLSKPFNPRELVARVGVMIRIKNLQDKLKTRIIELEKLSVIDELTGLYNKKYLFEYARREFDRCQRYGLSISVLMIDVDHFKEVNDCHGHIVGDQVLRDMGTILSDKVRCHDFSFRYGGDEFVVMLSHQHSKEGARVVAERIRTAVEGVKLNSSMLKDRISGHVTVSIGSASFTKPNVTNPEALLAEADQALYRAKAEGRNRVVSIEDP